MSITIGQRLKNAREERYLTLEKASEETRIRITFLKALEADDYSVMPSAAQGRGFLRNYSEYLNIDIDQVISELQKNAPPPQEVSGPLPQINLLETEVPPLIDDQEDVSALPFWRRWLRSTRAWFARPAVAEPEVETEAVEPVEQQPQPEVEEIKVEEPARPVEAEQEPVVQEPVPSLFTRFMSLFRRRTETTDIEFLPETSETIINEDPRQPAPVESPQIIFKEIGKKLRERRELISLTIEEVERHTKLRAALVKALEEGAFEKLPSPVQTRGMLANYAAFLDLDSDVILLRFADALQARHREKYYETPREKIQTEVVTSMPLLRSFIAGDLIFGVVMITIILALAVWGIGKALSSPNTEQIQSTAPSIVDVLAGTPLPSPSTEATFVPAQDLPIPGLDPATLEVATFGPNVNVVVSIFAVERTFVRISVDGEVAFEGRVAPHETQTYEAEQQVVVLTGNAAALRISYNGRDLGLMGDVGQVISQVYTIAGVVTPTATIPPTPTQTLPPTVTQTPSPTITFTPTPRSTVSP
jgi:cytoskeletal protein RodZ